MPCLKLKLALLKQEILTEIAQELYGKFTGIILY